MDPAAIIRACNQLGAALHLNEVTLAHPYMRFDNPGDAQFLPRQTLFDIFGFDERLIHGWHVDSNMCKRLFHLYGVTGSLADRLKGYCDHTRERTLAHRLDFRIESDPHEFVYNIDNPYASHQSHSWGLPEDAIEEIDFANGPPARFVSVVQRTLGSGRIVTTTPTPTTGGTTSSITPSTSSLTSRPTSPSTRATCGFSTSATILGC